MMEKKLQNLSDNKFKISGVISGFMIKYSKLYELILSAFEGSNATTVNLYIDLYPIYHKIITRHNCVDMSDYTGLTTSIIDLCIHYRQFFKRIGVYANIWLISSYNIPSISLEMAPEYNALMMEKLRVNPNAKTMVELNAQMLEVLCPYLPNIYFVKTNFESTVLMNHIIKLEMSKGNNNPNIILSTDLYPLQLCCKFNNTVLLLPNKVRGVDVSEITAVKGSPFYNAAFWSMAFRDRINNSSNYAKMTIDPCNYAMVISLGLFHDRGFMNNICIKKTNAYIYKLVQDKPIKVSPEAVYEGNLDFKDEAFITKKLIIDARFKTLSLDYQEMLFNESIEPTVLHYENLYDPSALQSINATYFTNNPIDLSKL